jgi:hypothetical protein
MAIENLKKYMILLALVISNTAFWLHVASEKKATCCWYWPTFFFFDWLCIAKKLYEQLKTVKLKFFKRLSINSQNPNQIEKKNRHTVCIHGSSSQPKSLISY